jgi:hypothetical protein
MWQEIVEGDQIRYYLIAIVVCNCVLCTWLIHEEIDILAEPMIQDNAMGRHFELGIQRFVGWCSEKVEVRSWLVTPGNVMLDRAPSHIWDELSESHDKNRLS